MKNFTKWQKLAIVALILMVLFNPLIVEVYIDYYKWAMTGVCAIATTYVVLFSLYKMLKPERVNIPSKAKAKKKPQQQYLEYEV